jgi:hypothetical protein
MGGGVNAPQVLHLALGGRVTVWVAEQIGAMERG